MGLVIFPELADNFSLCSSCTSEFEEYYPLENAIWITAVYAAAYFVLFLYFDSVLPNESGIRKHWLFFLTWMFHKNLNKIEDNLKESEGEDWVSSAIYEEKIVGHENKEVNLIYFYLFHSLFW